MGKKRQKKQRRKSRDTPMKLLLRGNPVNILFMCFCLWCFLFASQEYFLKSTAVQMGPQGPGRTKNTTMTQNRVNDSAVVISLHPPLLQCPTLLREVRSCRTQEDGHPHRGGHDSKSLHSSKCTTSAAKIIRSRNKAIKNCSANFPGRPLGWGSRVF